MNILPKFLYMFQSLPIKVPKSFFTSLNRLIRKFIWRGKTPRVSLKKLTLDYSQGGLQLPNFMFYYWASQARFLAQMFDREPCPSWLNIEKTEIKEETPIDLVYKWDIKLVKKETDNPLIIHLVQTWGKLQQLFGHEHFLTCKTPLWRNGLLPHFLNSKHFSEWSKKGILRLQHCYKDGVFMSFEQMKQEYDLSNKDFLGYLQLRDFIRTNSKYKWNLPTMTPMERFFHSDQPLQKIISNMYTALRANQSVSELDKSKIKWEQELGLTIDASLWTDLCKDSVTSTLNSRYRLIQYNFLHQLYITPSKLHRFNPKISPLCFRCGSVEGTFLHCTWTCPKVIPFWQKVCSIISEINGKTFPVEPEVCLLGDFTNADFRNKYALKLTEIMLITAKKCIALKWKSDTPIPVGMWLSELKSCVPLEKITYKLKNNTKVFYKTWQPFIDYVKDFPLEQIEIIQA